MIPAVPGRTVPVLPAGVARQQPSQRGEQVVVAAGAGLDDRETGGGVWHPDMQQAITAIQKRLALLGDVPDNLAGAGPDLDLLAAHSSNGSVDAMREAFGALFDIPAGYLNTASVGIPPVSVADTMIEAINAWRTGSVQPPEYDKPVAIARDAWARLAGVPVGTVAIGASVSQLISLVAASLPSSTRMVTVEQEFTSTTFPFAARNLPIVEVPIADLASTVDGNDLVVVSAVQSADGAMADLDAIRAAAAASGARVLLDVTQALGWLPLRLDWADWVVGGSYKWLLAPRGAAWMAVRPDALELTKSISANWYAGDDPWQTIYGLPLRLAPDARRLDLSPVWFAQVGAAASVPWLAELDAAKVYEHCVRLANATLTSLDLPPTGSAIISLDLPGAAERLAGAGVRASVRAGRVRLAFHLYNTDEDVALVVGALSGRA
jgi:selenocysteine lyase/cysteine desulfurase